MGSEDWWPFPHLINSKFIQPNKHELQNLLDKKALCIQCWRQNLTPYQISDATGPMFARNLEIYQSKPVMLTAWRFELNWFHIVLCTYVCAMYLFGVHEAQKQSVVFILYPYTYFLPTTVFLYWDMCFSGGMAYNRVHCFYDD